ncbi:MAG: phosphoribosylamine--glycine ligase [Alphaproteobacteria bacterium]|nr:phosphoribosylamine--glycine ligase [Alphaproteobacteria bacterium]
MKVLIIGKGGREHTLAWKIKQSPLVTEIFIAPGNGGTCELGTNIDINDHEVTLLVNFAKQQGIDFTIVGPESSLMAGVVDAFRSEGLNIFGPTKDAARIEGSKKYAKEIMQKYKIPTAQYQAFTDAEAAKNYIVSKKPPYVIKADNLAAGKGVIIAENIEEAYRAIDDILIKKIFNSHELIIEEFLDGIEFSFMCLVNGSYSVPLAVAQDFKRLQNDNRGPNTGGMGAISPSLQISQAQLDDAYQNIILPTIQGLVAESNPFTGVLYAGLIATKQGIKVIEFNARFGDPETEVVLPRLNSDLLAVLIDFNLGKKVALNWNQNYCLGVVLAAKGYPQNPKTGSQLQIETPKIGHVFHAGTLKNSNNELVINGGRVCVMVSLGNTPELARSNAYQCLKNIISKDLHYRTDIRF